MSSLIMMWLAFCNCYCSRDYSILVADGGVELGSCEGVAALMLRIEVFILFLDLQQRFSNLTSFTFYNLLSKVDLRKVPVFTKGKPKTAGEMRGGCIRRLDCTLFTITPELKDVV